MEKNENIRTKKYGHYQLIACTAIEASAGDTDESDRREAILVRDLEYKTDADMVLFGYILDEMDEGTFRDACAYDEDAFSGYRDDLDSVLIDGKPISCYADGEL